MPHPSRTLPRSVPEQWEHILGLEFPVPIQLVDASINKVKFRGTFNVRLHPEKRAMMLREAYRVLRPGGMLQVHLLISDREIEGKLPRLPDPVARVEYAPVGAQVIQDLEAAQFLDLYFKRFSPVPVFRYREAELRELLVVAIKPLTPSLEREEATVVYRGPFVNVADDFGVVYPRGEKITVSRSVVEHLRATHEEHFIFLESQSSALPDATRKNELELPAPKKQPLTC